jgi:hypothetical protein
MSLKLMLQALTFFNIPSMADCVILCNFLLWHFLQKKVQTFIRDRSKYAKVLKRFPTELIPDDSLSASRDEIRFLISPQQTKGQKKCVQSKWTYSLHVASCYFI